MVQYDPFAPLLVNTELPTRSKSTSGGTTPSLVDSPTTMDGADLFNLGGRRRSPSAPYSRKEASPHQDGSHHAVNPHLRRLSSSHTPHERYCSSCHMRRASQELLSITADTVDDFCPDITMPKSPRPAMHHARRHSGLCPENIMAQEYSDGTHSPTQMTLKPRTCRHNSSGYHHECHCESVKPVDNLSARYGIDEHSGQMRERRQSTEQEAMDQVSEIMHEEMMADMEAKQSRL